MANGKWDLNEIWRIRLKHGKSRGITREDTKDDKKKHLVVGESVVCLENSHPSVRMELTEQ